MVVSAAAAGPEGHMITWLEETPYSALSPYTSLLSDASTLSTSGLYFEGTGLELVFKSRWMTEILFKVHLLLHYSCLIDALGLIQYKMGHIKESLSFGAG